MKDYQKRAVKLNPIILLIYWVFCHYMMELMAYGGVAYRLPIIGLAGSALLVWLYVVKVDKIPEITKGLLARFARPWYYIAIISFLGLSVYTTYDVYQSSIPFQGKLSWALNNLQKTRKIKYRHDNVFEDGIEGLFQDIESRLSLPEALFISNEFSLSFNEEGEVLSVYSSLYGENKSGERASFLVDYNRGRDDRISVRLGRNEEWVAVDEEMRLGPLLDLMRLVSLEDVIAEWAGGDVFEVYYAGERSWGYNREGIVYYNADGVLGEPKEVNREIKGYTTSVYLPNNSSVVPKRFVYTEKETLAEAEGEFGEETLHEDRENEVDEEFVLNDKVQFRLEVLDAALGSRFYGLSKWSEETGAFELINTDPFNGSSGGAAGLTFIDEQLGFAALSHSGGAYADLYRTEDGGESFERIELPEVEVDLGNGKTYAPFVFPEMPVDRGDYLEMTVNQGAEGDYQGGIRAIFRSYDNGLTWEFIDEE